ncbi:hypothetical protein [Asticcacaulis machinosus]|uniref:Uncharacterized protein n=1 Tax=Asticcacaulis machinosus TaxID=2984211 RepID=A0ABT5HGI9_9CAUL|nr:hypothetical protein [Asticcacaulis machinosus]MDC7675303.1 hypothetical protein [Asticcacaulis machinosus]
MKLKTAIAFVRKGQWAQLKHLVASLSPEAAYELIKLIYAQIDMKTSFAGLVDSPDDVLGNTILGGILFGIARRHRGGGTFVEVTPERFARYRDVLEDSEACLRQALDIDRSFGLAAAFFMAVNMDPNEDVERDIAEARLLAADNVPLSGYMNLLLARCEKWGGDHDTMFRIGRAHMNPDKPSYYALITRAHWERHFYYAAFDEAPNADRLAERYFQQPEVIRDLKEASDSVLSANLADPAEIRLANGWLLFTFIRACKWKLARQHLQALKGFEDPSIWWFSSTSFSRLALWVRLRAALA